MDLMEKMVTALKAGGWVDDGGGPTLAYMHKDGDNIKLFRVTDSPIVRVCYTGRQEDR